MANITFNNAFFDNLSRSPEVTAIVVAKAEEAAEIARSAAPRDTGDYAKSIHVEVKHQKRVVALVIADDPKSMIIESKTGNLVRALNQVKRRGRG
jgi:hypothetical protein